MQKGCQQRRTEEEELTPFPKILAELRRAKRASEAPWVRKFGKPSIRENLVMTYPTLTRTHASCKLKSNVTLDLGEIITL